MEATLELELDKIINGEASSCGGGRVGLWK